MACILEPDADVPMPVAEPPAAVHGRPSAPRWRRRVARAATWFVALYLLALAALWWGQEHLLFQPQTLPPDHQFALAPDVHETWVDVPGARLNTLELRLPQPRGVVFFLHGNSGNLDNWFVDLDYYRRLNVDLVMLDYRGYGKSTGRIANQAQLSQDVRAAWQAVEPRYRGLKHVVYGRSLGTGLAAQLAADIQPELTVLVSPYQSMRSLAAHHYPWVPGAALRYPLPTDEWLPQVHNAVLLVHGAEDSVVPASHSLSLQALSPQAELMLLPGVGHGDVQLSAAYLEGVAQAIRVATEPAAEPPLPAETDD
jgi:uncharacterized protein